MILPPRRHHAWLVAGCWLGWHVRACVRPQRRVCCACLLGCFAGSWKLEAGGVG